MERNFFLNASLRWYWASQFPHFQSTRYHSTSNADVFLDWIVPNSDDQSYQPDQSRSFRILIRDPFKPCAMAKLEAPSLENTRSTDVPQRMTT